MAKIVISSLFSVIALITLIVIIITAGTDVVTVNVYNWGEYISDGSEGSYDTNAEFEKYYEAKLEKEYGKKVDVRVNYTTYASNEDLYAKLQSGAGGYDVIIPSDYMIERLKADGLIQPLDTTKIPNYNSIDEQFKNPFYDSDPDTKYSVMYTYGVIGIIYNTEVVAEEDLAQGWEILWNEKYKGQILQFNNPRDAFGTAMYALGIDVNNANEEDWQRAYQKLLEQKPLVQSYVMDEIYNKMESGEASIAAYYAGDCLSMMANNDKLAFFYPTDKDGNFVTNIFADAMCIPTSSENVEHAYEYINFMLDPVSAIANAEYIYYASPNTAVIESDEYKEYMEDDYSVIYPEEFYLEREGYPTQLAYMFDTYAYRDLDAQSRAKLNGLWENLKVDSTSFDNSIYIICAVILAILIVFLLYSYIRKKQKRKYYWNNNERVMPTITQISNKKIVREDFESTALYDIAVLKQKEKGHARLTLSSKKNGIYRLTTKK